MKKKKKKTRKKQGKKFKNSNRFYLICAVPAVYLISPDNILKVVVLPAPLTPSNVKHSPFLIPKDIYSTATL